MIGTPIASTEPDARRICERMLLALNAPVTDSNLAKLTVFAGILSSMKETTTNLKAIEAMIMGVDAASKVME